MLVYYTNFSIFARTKNDITIFFWNKYANMGLSKNKIILFLIVIPLSIWLLFVGFRNEKDPYWTELDTLLTKKFYTLKDAGDSLIILYNDFHNVQNVPDSQIMQLVSKPFMPTMEFSKLKEYFTFFKDKRSTIFSAVTGSGNTTLVDRVANLIATKPENKMVILCAPQFDLEYNKKYIGHFEGDKFIKGELLKFWDKCKQNPKEKFVCMMDNTDKINPETLFGPDIWQHFDDPKMQVVMGKDTITRPDNFYLLFITQTGVGQKIELTNEHLKRMGGMMELPIHPNELIMALREKMQDVIKDLDKKIKISPQNEAVKKDIIKLQNQLNALSDTVHIKKLVYFFKRTNEMIFERYSHGHQIGQWSDIRKNFLPSEFDNIKKIFKQHVNAYHPVQELKDADFDDILYTIKNDGAIPNTSPVWKTSSKLMEMGFASELGVAGSFALISGIIGWIYFRRRHLYVKDFTQQIYQMIDDFENKKIDYDAAHTKIQNIKRSFDDLVLDQKVNYNEAAFFYSFIEDKTRYIEIAREINGSFLRLMDVFLEDNVLTHAEYDKLKQFLEGMKHKINTPQYLSYKEEIERAYHKFGEKI
jgi:hypothetical protein